MKYVITYNPTGEAYGVTIQIKTDAPQYRQYVTLIEVFETPSEGAEIIVMDGEGQYGEPYGEPYDRWIFADGAWVHTLDKRRRTGAKT